MESKRGFHNTDCCSDLWSHQLQQDIIDLILERLGALDRISFGGVCTRWRAAVARSMANSALPFPFVYHADSLTHSISSLDDNRVYYLNPHNTVGGCFREIIEGCWLIMYRSYLWPSSCERQKQVVTGYSILNPVTRKEFLLPWRKHSTISDTCNKSCIDLPSFFFKMRASSKPTTSNCIVAGLSNSASLISFCRLTDSKWTLINLDDDLKDLKWQDIMFCRGKLYALTTRVEDFIIAFDFEDSAYKAHKIIMTVPWQISFRSRGGWFVPKERVSRYSFYESNVSLATDSVSGELFLIARNAKFLSKKSPPAKHLISRDFWEENLEKVEVVYLSVYKLKMTNNRGQWIKVTDLGDRMLFYGKSNFFISTKAYEESTHQGNCIYYVISENEHCCDVGKFCRGKLYALTKRFEDFIIAFDFEDSAYKAHKIVMTVPWQILEELVSSYRFYDSNISLATDSISGELLFILCNTKSTRKKFPPDHMSRDFREKKLEKVELISLIVYKLKMTNNQGQWIKVTDLGDRMLFYGCCSNFFISTKAYEESTHQGNCIYYAISGNEHCDVGKFCLNDQTIIRYPIKRGNACGWLAPQFTNCEFYN